MAKVICDIDGTLSDYSHRVALAGEWNSFHALAHLDPVIPQIRHLTDCLRESGHDILLWTGRPERYRVGTMDWLCEHGIGFNELRMRPNDNLDSDVALKYQWLQELGEQPLFAIDDRDSVVKMFRDNGVVCLQPAEGKY
jgi:hypothetical protein